MDASTRGQIWLGSYFIFPCLILGYVLINLKFLKVFLTRNISLFFLSILIVFSVGKNFNKLNFYNLTKSYKQDFDYSDISKLGVLMVTKFIFLMDGNVLTITKYVLIVQKTIIQL